MIEPEYITEQIKGLCAYLGEFPDIGVYDPTGYSPDYAEGAVIVRTPMAARPSLVIAVRLIATEPPDPNIGMVHVSYQIAYRGTKDPDEAVTKMGLIASKLHEKAGLALGRTRASLITAGALADLDPDLNGQHEFTQSFRVRGTGRLDTE